MSAAEKLHVRDFAKEVGVSYTAIAKGIKSGRLSESVSLDEHGRHVIDPVRGREEWVANQRVDKIRPKGTRPVGRPRKVAIDPETNEVVPTEGEQKAKATAAAINSSRAMRETYQARIAKIEYEERMGQLVSAAEVKAEAYRLGRQVRDNLLNVPARVTARMRAAPDEHAAFAILEDEIRKACEGLGGE